MVRPLVEIGGGGHTNCRVLGAKRRDGVEQVVGVTELCNIGSLVLLLDSMYISLKRDETYPEVIFAS